MFQTTGFGTQPQYDPNVSRAIEEIARVINEVEQRVQLVKLGLIQNFPHLALPLGMQRGPLGAFGSPFLGSAPSWSGVPVSPFSTNLYGSPGVMTPLNNLAASLAPFRY